MSSTSAEEGRDGLQAIAARPGAPGSLIAAQITLAVTDLNSADEQVRAAAVRALCPCRTRDKRSLDRYVVPMLHDPSPVVRWAANFVLNEELENEMVRQARNGNGDGRQCRDAVGMRHAA